MYQNSKSYLDDNFVSKIRINLRTLTVESITLISTIEICEVYSWQCRLQYSNCIDLPYEDTYAVDGSYPFEYHYQNLILILYLESISNLASRQDRVYTLLGSLTKWGTLLIIYFLDTDKKLKVSLQSMRIIIYNNCVYYKVVNFISSNIICFHLWVFGSYPNPLCSH